MLLLGMAALLLPEGNLNFKLRPMHWLTLPIIQVGPKGKESLITVVAHSPEHL